MKKPVPPPPKMDPPRAAIRTVVVEPKASLRQLLVQALRGERIYDVVGEAAGGIEGLRVCRALKPELVILDVRLPELNGQHVIRILLAGDWPVKVVVYTGERDDALLREAMAEGPHGFVRREDSLPSLYMALRAVMSGSRHLSRCSEHLVARRGGEEGHDLTSQERAVLQMIAEARQNKEIATVLAVSEKTVEHHRQNMMRKLCLHDVASLTRYAMRHGLVAA